MRGNRGRFLGDILLQALHTSLLYSTIVLYDIQALKKKKPNKLKIINLKMK